MLPIKIKPVTAKLQSILTELNQLNPIYSIKIIDREQCLYHKINDYYDIEVSGLNNQKKSAECTIFVWLIKPYRDLVEIIPVGNNLSVLSDTLAEIRNRYRTLTDQEKPNIR